MLYFEIGYAGLSEFIKSESKLTLPLARSIPERRDRPQVSVSNSTPDSRYSASLLRRVRMLICSISAA